MRFPSPGSAQGYYSYNFLNLMSYSKFIFKCISPTHPIGLLFYYLLFLSSTYLIITSIYNALEEASIEIAAVKVFQTKDMIRQGLSTVRMAEQHWSCTKVHIFGFGVCLPHKMASGLGNGP